MSDDDARSLDLPATARSTTQARQFVCRALSDWGLDGLSDTTALLTSEVVTNAVLHARTALTVTVRRDVQGVTVEVTDGSQREPVRRRQSKEATTGRGIDLLDRLASTWAVDVHGNGKTLQFTVSHDSDPWEEFSDTNWLEELQS